MTSTQLILRYEESSEIQILRHQVSTALNMPALGDYEAVSNSLKTAMRTVVVAKHKCILGIEGDRDNRKRLRAFSGFDYDETNIFFMEKSTYVKDN